MKVETCLKSLFWYCLKTVSLTRQETSSFLECALSQLAYTSRNHILWNYPIYKFQRNTFLFKRSSFISGRRKIICERLARNVHGARLMDHLLTDRFYFMQQYLYHVFTDLSRGWESFAYYVSKFLAIFTPFPLLSATACFKQPLIPQITSTFVRLTRPLPFWSNSKMTFQVFRETSLHGVLVGVDITWI